jgi:hypothetical protein
LDGISEVEASPGLRQEDLIINGDNVTIIEGRFDINGSIIVEENATLVLKDAVLNVTQTRNAEHEMTFRNPAGGNPRLEVDNATITASNYYFWISLYSNSSAIINNLTAPSKIDLVTHDSSSVSMLDSELFALYGYDYSVVEVENSAFSMLWSSDSSTVAVSNCTINSYLLTQEYSVIGISNSTLRELQVEARSVNCSIFSLEPGFFASWNYSLDCSVSIAHGGYAPEVMVKDSQIQGWRFDFYGSSNATIVNCTIDYLTSHDSSFVNMVNSPCSYIIIDYEGKVVIHWILNVHVTDSIGQDVPAANVTITYPNATLAQSKLSDVEGKTKMIMMEKMMNATGEYPVGNYTVEATYDIYSDGTEVNMTENRQANLMLENFIIPEFPSIHILFLFIIVASCMIIGCRKKRKADKDAT